MKWKLEIVRMVGMSTCSFTSRSQRTTTEEAKNDMQKYCNFFNGAGKSEWQNIMVQKSKA